MSTLHIIGIILAITATLLAVVAIVDLWRRPRRGWSWLAWTGLIILGLVGSTRGPIIHSETVIHTAIDTGDYDQDGTLRTSWIFPFFRVDTHQGQLGQSDTIWIEKRLSVNLGWPLPVVLLIYWIARTRHRLSEVRT